MTTATTAISEELKRHLTLNASTETYRFIPAEFEERDGKYAYFIQWDKIQDRHLTTALQNMELINQRIANRQQRAEILEGDIIRYLDGKEERVTHVWQGDSAQAGGGSGSYYMGVSGYASYSGGLNSGLPLNRLKLIEETKETMFWMFSRDSSGGGRGIYFYCPVKIWVEIEEDHLEPANGAYAD